MAGQNPRLVRTDPFCKKAESRRNLPDHYLQPTVTRISYNPLISEIRPILVRVVLLSAPENAQDSGREQGESRKKIRHVRGRLDLSHDFKDEAHSSDAESCALPIENHVEDNYGSGVVMVQNSMPYTGFDEILFQLRNLAPNILASFCIVSLQLPENPVQVTSKDLLNSYLGKGHAMYLPIETTERPWKIRQEFLDDEWVHLLTVQGDIVERNVDSKPSHRFVGELNLTALVRDLKGGSSPLLAELNEDPSLSIASEDMNYSFPRRSIQAAANFPEGAVVGAIRLLHAYYFIVKPSDHGYVISHLAPDLITSIGPEYYDLPTTAFVDLESLGEFFEWAESFCVRVLWQPSQDQQRLYCIPHFSPDLDCWLCFLVDAKYECLWAPNG
ncbi:hypothetical protein MMC07_001843 [Pseudocyphellaria aurata]|nr:hypothetical protein [Pseudocyphellaria aurata]